MKKLDLPAMRESAAPACGLLNALGNPERLLLLCQLSQGEFCVSELEEKLGILQPTLSQQLGVLRNEELVSTRREGKWIYYRVASQEALSILETLYGLYCGQQPDAVCDLEPRD